ncbi:hypothetical protein PM082_005056 [Marasmius tenuissimus]|nr:hypothetical protein PM082_005056 [Marasmius tenuissimus]
MSQSTHGHPLWPTLKGSESIHLQSRVSEQRHGQGGIICKRSCVCSICVPKLNSNSDQAWNRWNHPPIPLNFCSGYRLRQ